MAAKQENDKLNDANLDVVIEMLNPSDPLTKAWTKKECCTFLGIAYNTARLTKLIEEYQDKTQYEKECKAKKKGTAATSEEIKFTIQEYVDGSTIESIAKALYRGTAFVKSVLAKNNVTMRPISHSYFAPELVPEEAARDRFNIGDIVYSTRYNVNAKVCLEEKHPTHGYVYRVWLMGDCQQFAYTAAYDLASLDHLTNLGVKISG